MSREQKLEDLINLVVAHYEGGCSCDKSIEGFMCLANRFLTGNLCLEDTLDELD